MENNFIAETKVSSKKNKGNSYSYSTAIPKPILNKFGLKKGTKLYWDIDGLSITITPELPETKSIEAGLEIFNDMLINGNTSQYTNSLNSIKTELKIPADKKSTKNKINSLVEYYNEVLSKPDKKAFTKVVTYLLDYPLEVPNQYEILNEVYNQITQTD